MKRLLLIAILLSVFVPMTQAQDDEPECDVEAAQSALETALEDLDGAEDPLEVISEARRELAHVEAECLGLGPWEGTSEQVIGPVEIPAGFYRVTVATNGFFAMTITVIDGECGPDFGRLIFNLSNSEDPERTAESLIQSEGCTALFETDNITLSDGYTITFEKLD